MFKVTLAAAAFMLAAGAANAVPVKWSSAVGGNDHYYELITATQYDTIGGAIAAAASNSFMGMTGYLATITSAAEQSFLNASVNPNGAQVWLGGSDATAEGAWEWITGPEAGTAFGYTNWDGGEPNNCCGGEDGLMGWWLGDTSGAWNDLDDNDINGHTGGILVEYSAKPSVVPLPAGAGLLLTALAGFGLARRRRK